MIVNKLKIATIIAVALLLASFALIAESVQLAQAQTTIDVTQLPHGGSPEGTSGLPDLGPLPPGVTPDYTIEQTAYMGLSPNPIGVGQQLLVNLWTSPGMYHAFYGAGYIVDIIKPDGSTEQVGPLKSYLGDDTAWFQYVPTMPGTYQFKFTTEGTYLPAGNYTDRPGTTGGGGLFGMPGNIYPLYTSVWYKPCETDWQNVTVQADLVASWPPSPLPSGYWTRPISPENREWYPISGVYPFTTAVYYPGGRVLYASNYKYTAYVQAPNTAHVLWRRQGANAGLIGGYEYQYSTYTGGGNPSIVYNGRAYQSLTLMKDGVQTTVLECYNLRTGQVYWDLPVPTAYTSFFGMLFPSSVTPTCVSFEQSAAEVPGEEAALTEGAYLVAVTSSSLLKWDPYSGNLVANVTLPTGLSAQSAGAGFFGAGGTPIYANPYVLSIQTIGSGASTTYRLINWTVAGTDSNFTNRIQPKAGTPDGLWNISWPRSSMGTVDFDAGLAVTASWANPPGPQWCIGYDIQSVDLQTGQELFHITSNDTLTYNNQGTSLVVDRGKIALDAQNRHWMCFNGRTGKVEWISDLTAYPWGNWWAYSTSSYDFNESKGAIIACSYAGLYAFDWDNGHILWHYESPMAPFESPYGDEPFFTGVSMADGKVYVYGGEHTTSEPITRGWHLHCVNATTGEGIWKITGPMTPGAIADGYLTASNPYDGYMYVFGKGPSATTVTAPDVAVPLGTAFTIKGTVLDKSPGDQGSFQNPVAPLDSPTAPGTVPCVSATSMQTQMEYLYMQHPIDGIWHNESITGVPVTLTAIDSDYNAIDIGTTTTNGYGGNFGVAWTPTKEGTYTIYASFAGDDSYGSSDAYTTVTVGPAPVPIEIPPTTQPVDNTMLLYGILAAVIIAVIASLAALAIVLRKR
jgi:hypothetical protein